jgi:hypothetical protein
MFALLFCVLLTPKAFILPAKFSCAMQSQLKAGRFHFFYKRFQAFRRMIAIAGKFLLA